MLMTQPAQQFPAERSSTSKYNEQLPQRLPEIPKLCIRKSSLKITEVSTRDNRLEQQREMVREDARRLLRQNQTKLYGSVNQHSGHLPIADNQSNFSRTPRPSLQKSSETGSVAEFHQSIYQELTIKSIEYEGLKTQATLNQAKHQTEMLIRESRIEWLQDKIQQLQALVEEMKYRHAVQLSNSARTLELAIEELINNQASPSLEKLEKASEGRSTLYSSGNQTVEAVEIEQRISKLKEIERQERRTAQSLLRIVQMIKDQNGVLLANRISRHTQTLEGQTGFQPRAAESEETDSKAVPSTQRYENVQRIIGLQQEIISLHEELQRRNCLLDQLQAQCEAHQEVSTAKLELEEQQSRLASIMVDKELELERMRMALCSIQANQAASTSHSSHERELRQEVDCLESENRALRDRIMELTETPKLERQRSQEKLQLQKKISHLCQIIQRMEGELLKNAQQPETPVTELPWQEKSQIRNQEYYRTPEIIIEKTHSTLFDKQHLYGLERQVKQKEERIQQLSQCIGQLEKNIDDQLQLIKFQQRQQHELTNNCNRLKEELRQFQLRSKQADIRAQKQDELKNLQLEQSFVREQLHLQRIGELENQLSNFYKNLKLNIDCPSELLQLCSGISRTLGEKEKPQTCLLDCQERLEEESAEQFENGDDRVVDEEANESAQELTDKNEERSSFYQAVKLKTESLFFQGSELEAILSDFLRQLFHYPNHEHLFDRIDHFLQDIKGYESQHRSKSAKLQKSIQDYVELAEAILDVGQDSEQNDGRDIQHTRYPDRQYTNTHPLQSTYSLASMTERCVLPAYLKSSRFDSSGTQQHHTGRTKDPEQV